MISTLGSCNSVSSFVVDGPRCFLWVVCFYSVPILIGWQAITSGQDVLEKTEVLGTLAFLLFIFLYSFKIFLPTSPDSHFRKPIFRVAIMLISLYGRRCCGWYWTLSYTFWDLFFIHTFLFQTESPFWTFKVGQMSKYFLRKKADMNCNTESSHFLIQGLVCSW